MPRHNPVKAAAARRHNGIGALYAHLLVVERRRQERFGVVNGMRRPRYRLDALEAGEPVEYPVSLIPRVLRPPWCEPDGGRIVVTPYM